MFREDLIIFIDTSLCCKNHVKSMVLMAQQHCGKSFSGFASHDTALVRKVFYLHHILYSNATAAFGTLLLNFKLMSLRQSNLTSIKVYQLSCLSQLRKNLPR